MEAVGKIRELLDGSKKRAEGRNHDAAEWLERMNRSHAVIGNLGGKCRVIEELPDYSMGGRVQMTVQTFEDLRNRYMNQMVSVGIDAKGRDILKPVGRWWLEHGKRRQYSSVVFAPEVETTGAYNLWQGFSVEPKQGCGHDLYMDHLYENICGGNLEHADYLISWMANAVQRPGSPGQVAIVLRGGQGTGKGVAVREFGKLWGRHFLQVSDPKHLVGSFNAHLRDCVVLFADEAFYAGDKKHESILKTLITEEQIVIERKGVDAEPAQNCVHLMMASNSSWVVPAGLDDRRYFVLDVSDARRKDSGYFGDLTKEMDAGGRASLLYYLKNLDLTSWNIRKVPQTSALRDQKQQSYSFEEEWWYRKLVNGENGVTPSWSAPVSRLAMYADYLEHAQASGIYRRASATTVDKFVISACGRGIRVGPSIGAHGQHYHLPDLDSCRSNWDDKFGGPYEW